MNHFELEAYLSELLDVPKFADYAPNGIQIEGKPQIQKIATAVSASLAVVVKAIAFDVDALFVHHGYFWKGEPYALRGIKKNRIAALLKKDINLFSYHLPLDAYPIWGNNASMALRLETTDIIQKDLLWVGQLSNSKSFAEMLNHLKNIYGLQVQGIQANTQSIKKIAWCSGAAYDFFDKAIQAGVDAFITGEYTERSYHIANESKVNFFAAGHHATEKDGIRFLGEHLSEKFHLKHIFIDEDNPF